MPDVEADAPYKNQTGAKSQSCLQARAHRSLYLHHSDNVLVQKLQLYDGEWGTGPDGDSEGVKLSFITNKVRESISVSNDFFLHLTAVFAQLVHISTSAK